MTTISATTHGTFSFSLRFLFLVTTLAAACCGLALVIPGMGVLLAFVTMAAFARTCLAVRYRESHAGTGFSQMRIFLGSIVHVSLIVLLIGLGVPLFLFFLILFFFLLSGMVTVGAQAVISTVAMMMLVIVVKSASSLARAIWSFI